MADSEVQMPDRDIISLSFETISSKTTSLPSFRGSDPNYGLALKICSEHSCSNRSESGIVYKKFGVFDLTVCCLIQLFNVLLTIQQHNDQFMQYNKICKAHF